MAARALLNKKGFTLVEVLVSMLILAIGLIGSLVGIMAAFDQNLGNTLRNEAIKVAQQRAEEARNMLYQNIKDIPSPQTIKRQVRKSVVDFTVTTDKAAPPGFSPGMTKLTITVQWTQKDKSHQYKLETVVGQTL
jgi:type IV pilus assembly protein PilV